MCEQASDVAKLAARAADGELGDTDDWIAAERRWRERGLPLSELLSMSDDRWPFPQNIRENGFPVGGSDPNIDLRSPNFTRLLLSLYRQSEGSPLLQKSLATWLFEATFRWSHAANGFEWLTPGLLRTLLSQTKERFVQLDFLEDLMHTGHFDPDWMNLLDELGRSSEMRFFPSPPASDYLADALLRVFCKEPEKEGLIPVLASLLATGRALGFSDIEVQPHLYHDEHIRAAAVLLALADRSLTAEYSRELAAMMADFSNPFVHDALIVISNNELFSEATDTFLMEVYKRLSVDNWDAKTTLMRGLNDSFRRRSSGIDTANTYKKLALPEGLIEILSDS